MSNSLFYGFFITALILGCASKNTIPVEQAEEEPILNTNDSIPDNITDGPLPLYSIPIKSKYFTTDKLSQVYVVTEGNQVIKFDASGKEVFRYNNNLLKGKMHIDATNPFNILLYYPDFQSVITLDRTMSETGEFNLSDLNFIQVNAVGSSNDNNIWLYDELTFKLKKINRSGTVFRESIDLNLQLNYSPRPVFLIERENNVYLNDPDFGIVVFNIFGEYDSKIDLKGIDQFQVFENQLIYKKGEKLFSYHLQTFNLKELKIPVRLQEGEDVFIQKNRLFIRKVNRVEVYEIGEQ